jgi:hydrogenase expression/formation protein HypC
VSFVVKKIKLMCLAIPGKLESITSELDEVFRIGSVDFEGIKKEVNLALVPEAKIGDYVLVHVGADIGIIDEEEAKKTMDAEINGRRFRIRTKILLNFKLWKASTFNTEAVAKNKPNYSITLFSKT